MRPVSDAFLRAVRGSHTATFRARVCDTFQTGTNPNGVEIPILSGEVILDGTADIRGSLTLETDVPWPVRASDLAAPYGNEIYVERGVKYNDASTEWVGLGYFRIDTPEQDDATGGPITITATDRMSGIIDGRLLAPRQYPSSTTLAEIFNDLIGEIYPGAAIEWDDETGQVALRRSVICERERFEFLDDIVRSYGKIWYWDHRGVLVIRSAPDEDVPVWDIECGAGALELGGTLMGMSRSLTREGVYNAVVVTGEGVDDLEPVYGVAADLNPDSPTYFHGRFGKVPMFYSSQFITSNDQATVVASAMLRQRTGLPYSVDLEAAPNPALEPWDPITVRPSYTQAIERHVLASLTIPLVPDAPMRATTRQKLVTLIGGV